MRKTASVNLEEVLDAIAQVPSRRRAGLARSIKLIQSGAPGAPSLQSVYNAAINEVRLHDKPTEQARERRRNRLAQNLY